MLKNAVRQLNYLSGSVMMQIMANTDVINMTTTTLDYMYLYGPLLIKNASGNDVDVSKFPLPEHQNILENNTSEYVVKQLEPSIVQVRMGQPFSAGDDDITVYEYDEYSLYKYDEETRQPKLNLVQKRTLASEFSQCRFVYFAIFRATGNKYNRFMYMVLPAYVGSGDIIMADWNKRIYDEFLNQYPEFEEVHHYIIDTSSSDAIMIGFQPGSSDTRDNKRCIFPILSNCTRFCKNCDPYRNKSYSCGSDYDSDSDGDYLLTEADTQ